MLHHLVDPIETVTFYSDYWGKKPLHVARQLPGWCSELPSIDDIDSIIALTPISSGGDDLSIARNTTTGWEQVRVERGPAGRPDMSALYRAFAVGWTIVVNGLGLRWPPAARLAASLADEFACNVGINLYLSPSVSRGLPLHSDTHDVFLLQLEGNKSWRIYAPQYELPLEDWRQAPRREDLKEPLLEVTTQAGHLLYIPKGFIHEGAANSQTSMHVTIGVYTTPWVEILEAGLRAVADEDVRFRRSVPAIDLEDEAALDNLAKEFGELLQSVRGRAVVLQALRRMRESRRQSLTYWSHPHFKAIERARSLAVNTEVARRFGAKPRVMRGKDRVRIAFGMRSVSAPIAAAAAFEFICTQPVFSVGLLPGNLSDHSKITLVRRLVQEGLLTIMEPGQ